MNHTKLLQSALEAMRGYRQEHSDAQPCDTERAIEAALAEQAAEQRPQNCGTGFCSCIECPYGTQQAAEPNAVLVEGFGRVAMRKLNDLREKGYAINGVSIATISEAGETQLGAVTTGGRVLWWPQQATEPVAGQTRPLGYLPKWSVDRLTGDMGKVADPLVWGLYTHVYLSSVDHSVAIYTSPQSAATQPLTDEQWLKRWTRESGQRLKPGPERDRLLRVFRFAWRAAQVPGKEGGAA